METDVELSGGASGRASVPSGASTGSHEAIELRDNDPKRYGGKGVLKAVENVNSKIFAAVKGKGLNQEDLDRTLIDLDGTADKSDLGANAILSVSLSFARAAAENAGKPLYAYFNGLLPAGTPLKMPAPMMNIMNGGKHALDSSDIQEFMIVPNGFGSFAEALRAGSEIFHALKDILVGKGLPTTVGDEGGFAPPLSSNEAPIELILEAVGKAGYKAGKEVGLALDTAATELYKDGSYHFKLGDRTLDSNEMISWYEELIKKYPIMSIEDGLAEDDWNGWTEMTKRLGPKIMLVGDDLFVTSTDRLKKGIERGAANSVLIKPNQIGTISETMSAIVMAKEASYSCVISHRSGETDDTSIADLAVGTGVGWIKAGSVSRAERVAKYDRLLIIESEL